MTGCQFYGNTGSTIEVDEELMTKHPSGTAKLADRSTMTITSAGKVCSDTNYLSPSEDQRNVRSETSVTKDDYSVADLELGHLEEVNAGDGAQVHHQSRR